jgi:hypothetical protein
LPTGYEKEMEMCVVMRLEISHEVDELLRDLSLDEGVARAEILRRAISVMKAFRMNKAKFPHIGFVSNASKLDVEITGVLT